jgi:hypothetical protein
METEIVYKFIGHTSFPFTVDKKALFNALFLKNGTTFHFLDIRKFCGHIYWNKSLLTS